MRYTPNTQKALEVILWFAIESPSIDVYHVVKGAFYADKFHIREFGRPIIGDEYRAAPLGPLPQVVYGIIRKDPIEIIALESNGYVPISMDNAYRITAERDPNLRQLSKSDVRALRHGLEMVKDKDFRTLYEMTHDEPAYIRARSGIIDYRDFLDDQDPKRDEKAAELEEEARYAVF